MTANGWKARGSKGKSRTSSKDIQFKQPEETITTGNRDLHRGDLETLHELFGLACEWEIIDIVYRECGSNIDRATDALLALSAHSAAQSSPSSETLQAALVDLWDVLTEDLKGLVLKHLNARDVARAARTSKEFANHARKMQLGVRTLHLPPDISVEAIAGMRVAEAVELGQAARPAPRAAIEGVDLQAYNASCVALDFPPVEDGDVALLCQMLPSLSDFNLKGCQQIKDTTLATLSRHFPQLPESDTESSDELDEEEPSREPGMRPGMATSDPDTASSADSEESPEVATAGPEEPGSAQGAASPGYNTPVQNQRGTSGVATSGRASVASAGTTAGLGDGTASSRTVRDGPDWRRRRSKVGIRRVVLDGCRLITAQGVQALMNGPASAKSLEFLDISNCVAVTDEGLRMNSRGCLSILRANRCRNLTRLEITATACQSLQELILTNCGRLVSVNIAAHKLERLKVSGCGELRELIVACPKLTELAAAQCRELLRLGPPFQAPSLSHLNLFGCRRLLSGVLQEALNGCRELRDLHLDGCTALDTLLLSGTVNLRQLVVRGCRGLRTASVSSPHLTSLSAIACTSLVTLRLESSKLEMLELGNCASLQTVQFPALYPSRDPYSAPSKVAVTAEGCNALPALTIQRLQALGHGRA
eukprot:jgi/Botrbrau1/15722/Bobra.4_1s0091.1